MNTHVNFEIAKLLKEKGFNKGFDGGQKFYYPLTKELTENHRGDNYPAPTIAEVVMWLYEKHGIFISADTGMTSFYGNYKVYLINTLPSKLKQGLVNNQDNPAKSITEAYEAAILYVLNNSI